jgi:hypothetical protein
VDLYLLVLTTYRLAGPFSVRKTVYANVDRLFDVRGISLIFAGLCNKTQTAQNVNDLDLSENAANKESNAQSLCRVLQVLIHTAKKRESILVNEPATGK